MEIERLTARVDADTRKAELSIDRLDRKLDKAAEDRTSTITVVEKGGLGKGVTGGSKGGFGPPQGQRFNNNDGGGGGVGKAVASGGGDDAKKNTGFFDDMTRSVIKGTGSILALHKGLGLVRTALGLLGKLQLMAVAAAGAAALGGAVIGLVAALGPLTGLLAVIPVGLGAMAAAALAVAPAVMGFTKGLGELFKAEEAGKQNAQSLAQAYSNLASAQRTLANATEDMAKARHEAGEAIEDAQLDAEGAQISEARAIRQLKRAYEELADVQNGIAGKTTEITKVTDDYTGKQFEVARITASVADEQGSLEDAMLSVREAELSVARAKDANSDAQLHLNEMTAKGIDNSDIMVGAQERLTSALEGVAAANRQLADTQTGIKDQTKEFDKMSPAAQRVSKMILGLKPVFEDFQRQTQEPLFLGIESGLKTALPFLPVLIKGLLPITAVFGDIAAGVGGLFEEFASSGDMTTFLDQVAGYLRKLTPGLFDFIRGFKDIAIAAEPLITFLVEGFSNMGEAFADWAEEGRESGSFAEYFQETIDVIKKLWAIFKNLGHAFGNILDAAKPLGDWLLTTFVEATGKFSEWTDKVSGTGELQGWFDSLKKPISEAAKLVRDIVSAFFELFATPEHMDRLAGMISWIRTDVLPVLENWIDMLTNGSAYDVMSEKSGLVVDAIGKIGTIIRDDVIPKVGELWGKFLEFKESEGFKNFMQGVQDFITWVTDTAVPRIQEWWAEFSVGDTISSLADNFWDIWDAISTFTIGITDSKIIDFLGDVSRLALELTDRVPGLSLVIGGLVAAWAGTSMWNKFQMPSNIKKMTGVFDTMSKSKDGFIDNTKTGAPKIKTFFSKIGDFAKTAGSKMVNAIKGVGPKIVSAAGAVASGMGKMASGVGSALGKITMFMMANPWILLVAALVAAVVLIILNWDKVLAFLKAVWAWVKDNWPLLLAILTGPFGIAVYMIIKYWDEIKAGLSAAWDWIKDAAGTAWEFIKNLVMTPINWIWSEMQRIWDLILEVIQTAWDKIWGVLEKIGGYMEDVGGFFQGLWDKVIEVWDGIWDKVEEVIGWIGDAIGGIPDFFTGIWDGLTDGLRAAVNFVLSGVETLANGIAGAFNGTVIKGLNWINPGPDIPEIPTLILPRWEERAMGGPFKGFGLVGEKGPELIYSGPGAMVMSNNDTKKMFAGLNPTSSGEGITTSVAGNAGLSYQDMQSIMQQVFSEAKPNVTFDQDFHTDVNSKQIASDIAWRIAS